MYDPCGTQKLEGNELIKRLAEALDVPCDKLKMVLARLVVEQEKLENNP